MPEKKNTPRLPVKRINVIMLTGLVFELELRACYAAFANRSSSVPANAEIKVCRDILSAIFYLVSRTLRSPMRPRLNVRDEWEGQTGDWVVVDSKGLSTRTEMPAQNYMAAVRFSPDGPSHSCPPECCVRRNDTNL